MTDEVFELQTLLEAAKRCSFLSMYRHSYVVRYVLARVSITTTVTDKPSKQTTVVRSAAFLQVRMTRCHNCYSHVRCSLMTVVYQVCVFFSHENVLMFALVLQSPSQNTLSQKQREEMILARVRRSPAYKGQ